MVIYTMAMRLTHLRPVHGFCAKTAAASMLVGTALAGIPVGTTHTTAGKIVWGVLTIPASAAVGSAAYLVVQ